MSLILTQKETNEMKRMNANYMGLAFVLIVSQLNITFTNTSLMVMSVSCHFLGIKISHSLKQFILQFLYLEPVKVLHLVMWSTFTEICCKEQVISVFLFSFSLHTSVKVLTTI